MPAEHRLRVGVALECAGEFFEEAGVEGIAASELVAAEAIVADAHEVSAANASPPALGPWPDSSTTVMLRNIPNRYTAEELLAEMIAGGFEGDFDFFYLPIDFKTKRNRGYSFINFLSVELAAKFVQAFHAQRLTRYTTQKILEVSPAVTQGYSANVERYLRKDAQRIKNSWFRPLIFKEGGSLGAEGDVESSLVVQPGLPG